MTGQLFSPRTLWAVDPSGVPLTDGNYVLEVVDGKVVGWAAESGGGGGSGIVETIVAGTNVTVDDTDPANPEVSASFTETLPASIINAKGDLIAGTADNTAARLAVGATGETLIADSSATAGVKYASGSVPVIPLAAGSDASDVPAGTPTNAIILIKA